MKAIKLLLGSELAGYIKERQAHRIRSLVSQYGIRPKLAIVYTGKNPVIDLYIKMKQAYAQDIGAEVSVCRINQSEAVKAINNFNQDRTITGIIIQLPLEDVSKTDELVNLVAVTKDVDGLNKKTLFEPATPLAILWLLAGFNVELKAKKILLIGRGKLVGQPLYSMLLANGLDVQVADRSTKDLRTLSIGSDVIITATGQAGILTDDMVKSGAVIVDAGVASENGKTVGDVADNVYLRQDITITPKKGGVGPLTICALFDNLIRATELQFYDQAKS